MKIERKWAMPSHHTFTIKPIKELLERYVPSGGKNWIDPFAGEHSVAEITNDLNPNKPTQYHLEAIDFLKQLDGEYDGGLYDPPYSLRQIMECYDGIGCKVDKKWATTKFYSEAKTFLAEKIKMGGIVISFGWNTIGMGKTRGYEIIEVLVVSHGRLHNDTLVTVEKKITKTTKQLSLI